MEPVLSIVIPVYNAEKTLARCVDSLVGQKLTEGTLEIILVDDGSRDESPALCDAYAARDARIQVIHQSNAGVSAARNAGLERASGEYVQFVDSDDSVDDGYCDLLCRTAREKDCALVITCCREVWDGEIRVIRTPTKDMAQWREHPDLFMEIYLNGLINVPHCKLYRRDKIRAGFPEEFSMGEDLLFNYAYLEGVDRVTTLDVQGYNMFCSRSSLSHRYRDMLFSNALLLHDASGAFFERAFSGRYDRKMLARMLMTSLRRIAGMLVMYGPHPRAEKMAELRRWMRDDHIKKALREATAESGAARVFNAIVRTGSPGLLYAALKVFHNTRG
jgi:hypothetical protein